MKFDRSARIHEVLETPQARAVVDRYLPCVLDQPQIHAQRSGPLRFVLDHPVLIDDPRVKEQIWQELTQIDIAVPERDDEPKVQPLPATRARTPRKDRRRSPCPPRRVAGR
ncbi:hypothetical protein ACBJ59_04360 [Nonomuraea sp. MTCD27]|uniref:hypothetical protein n=1 Tax=Nonomuraea sp. MTCD27 TaxID=1676747 RepID=UPI0035C12FA2